MIRRALLAAALLISASPLFAIRELPRHARIYVLDGDSISRRLELMPSFLADELRDEDFDARTVDATMDEISKGEREADEYFIEISDADRDGDEIEPLVTHGAATFSGRVRAKVRLYDSSLKLVNSFTLSSMTVVPGGVDIFDFGVLTLPVPAGERVPRRVIAKALARRAADRIIRDLHNGRDNDDEEDDDD